MKIETKILRKRNLFLNPQTRQIVKTFDSVAQARRESRIQQQANGGSGRGHVKVIDGEDKV